MAGNSPKGSSKALRSTEPSQGRRGKLLTATTATPTMTGVRPRSVCLPRGTQLGRYALLGRIGVGGMGEVYSEHERKVALKLLHPDSAEADTSLGPMRLLREAQAMARLSHPNVVAIYDVGTFEDHVFIAMEYVAGRTLRHWLKEADRDWRQIVENFVEAGRGLGAAHAASVLHRDFKPENVLVGNDGRCRVLDFGLARANERDPDATQIDVSSLTVSKAKKLALELSRSGAMVGTPAYMSPEQLLGQSLDARADQFSFCVSLYEALYGERPFAGENLGVLMGEVIAGKVKRPRGSKKVPPALRKVLLRGLRPKPGQRYPSMDALLSELQRIAVPSRADQDLLSAKGRATDDLARPGRRRQDAAGDAVRLKPTGAILRQGRRLVLRLERGEVFRWLSERGGSCPQGATHRWSLERRGGGATGLRARQPRAGAFGARQFRAGGAAGGRSSGALGEDVAPRARSHHLARVAEDWRRAAVRDFTAGGTGGGLGCREHRDLGFGATVPRPGSRGAGLVLCP